MSSAVSAGYPRQLGDEQDTPTQAIGQEGEYGPAHAGDRVPPQHAPAGRAAGPGVCRAAERAALPGDPRASGATPRAGPARAYADIADHVRAGHEHDLAADRFVRHPAAASQ